MRNAVREVAERKESAREEAARQSELERTPSNKLNLLGIFAEKVRSDRSRELLLKNSRQEIRRTLSSPLSKTVSVEEIEIDLGGHAHCAGSVLPGSQIPFEQRVAQPARRSNT